MDNGQFETVERQLRSIEAMNQTLMRDRRRWRWFGGGVSLAATLMVVCGASVREEASETVEAGSFVLRDDRGRMRAALTIRPDGTPGLGLLDEAERVRLSLDMGQDGTPSVNLHDERGALQAAVAIRPDGTPGVGLFDDHGRPRLSLDTGGDGMAGVNIFGADGVLRAALAIRADGTPALGLFDARGQIRQSIDLGQQEGAARLRMQAPDQGAPPGSQGLKVGTLRPVPSSL